MPKLLLDSDVLVYFLNGNYKIAEHFNSYILDDLATSRINYTELIFGAYNSNRIEKNLNKLLPFLEKLEILEFDKASAIIFAKEKARLKKAGMPISDMDLMIASIAISNNLLLVTNNLRHFERLKNIRLERWI